MATKKTGAAKAAPKPQVEEIVVEQEIITAPDPVVIEPKKSEWEYKDRTYYLISNKQPIVMTLPS
jgi:hypothetical protein